jgi:hypothetical protein
MKYFKKIGVAFVIFIAFMLATELYFRLANREELKDQFSPLIYRPDQQFGYRYIPNSNGKISKPGIPEKYVHINSAGYYTPEFKAGNDHTRFRIVIVGTSFAAGIYMKGKDNYAVKLQNLFNHTGKKVEVINCSIDGQGRGLGNLNLVTSELTRLEPDLICMELSFPISFGTTYREIYKNYLIPYKTAAEKSQGMEAVDEIESKKTFKFLYDNSYIFRAYCRNYIRQHQKSKEARLMRTFRDKIARTVDADEDFLTSAKSLEVLKATSDTVKHHPGQKLLLVSYGADQYQLGSYLQSGGLQVSFLNLEFGPEQLSLPDSHINEKGHQLIAQTLFKILSTPDLVR